MPSRYQLEELQHALAELELREMHPLAVYRPTNQQLPVHESSASEVLTVGGKRSGKTLAVVMEFASRVLGVQITREDGSKIPLRFRKPTKRNPALYWVIGLNVDHIGQTLYHRLFSPGLGCNYRIIQDSKSKKWRAYNPNTDRVRYEESRLSPPLFGEDIIDPKTWHFESRAGNVFKSVNLANGTAICAYPSTGDSPKQGDAVDGIWIDEDIERGAFLKEWQDRLISVRGWFLWSVWPKVANQALIKTLDRAKIYEEMDKPPIKVFRLIGSENPYSDKEGIAEGLLRMEDDDDVAHRDRGDIDAFISGRRMYDFGATTHVVKPEKFDDPQNAKQVIANHLHHDVRELPREWTRYISIDPSHTCTACLIGVVPPPDHKDLGDRLIIEREIVVRKHTPAQFVEVLALTVGHLYFEAFIMDQMAGRATTIGADATVFQVYEREFVRRGLISRVTKHGFMRGSNDKSERRRTVRDLLEPTLGGVPRLLVSARCPQTIKQFYEFRKKEIKDQDGNPIPTDDGMAERLMDCVIAAEYLCQYVMERFRQENAFMLPEARRAMGNLCYRHAMELLKKDRENEAGEYVHLGPGATI